MQCAHCSTPVPDDARFCHSCGSQVSDAEGQARVSASMDISAFQHMERLLKEDTEGEFEIEGMLGRGGMAVVFLATELKLGRKVAIKVLPPELTFGHGVDRFLREAKTAALLDHPHIIPIYRICSGGKIFWYAMKFLEGRSLDDLIKEKGRLPVEETIPILEQVADALDYAHQHNVIHRDMKPANVMLDSRNRVIVTDFGIAKALTEQTLTASGSVVGTPYYMSPEQGMGTGVSGRSDQYSVAVMAYRMLSGQFPFEGDSAIDILHKHCMMPPSPLEVTLPGLAKDVYLAVHKALAKKPERRFSSVTAFVRGMRGESPELDDAGEVSGEGQTVAVLAADVRGRPGASGRTPPTPAPGISTAKTVVSGTVTPVTHPPRPSAPRPKPKRKRGALVAAGLLLLAGGGIGGYVVMRAPAQAAAPPASQPPPATHPAVQAVTEPAPAATPAPTTGHLTVSGVPSSGGVLVDGRRQRGTEFDLQPGRHVVRIEATGFVSVTAPITIEAGRQVTVPFTGQPVARAQPAATSPAPKVTEPAATSSPPAEAAAPSQLATLQIGIDPPATLSINNVGKGEQSRLQEKVPPGTYLLHVEKPGFISLDTTVTVQAGAVRRVIVKLAARP